MLKMFNIISIECLDIIIEFAGVKEHWKHRFSTDVLTKIDQGWMEVGNGNDREYGYIPCANCYMYSQTDCGDGRFCMNCAHDEGVETSFVNFDQMKGASRSCRYFEDFETFKRYRDVYNNSVVRVTEKMLKNSSLFKQIRMLNAV